VFEKDANGKRGVDRHHRQCMKCVDNDRKLQNWDLHAKINILQLLAKELERPERPAF